MVLNSESLQLARLRVFNNANSLVHTDAVVKSCRTSLHLDGPVRKDLGRCPAFLFAPVDREHVVREKAAKRKLVLLHWLDLSHIHSVHC